jgi:hypothetical protein
MAESLCLTVNNIDVKFAYADLDGDGINELLIGDAEGVYAIISEEAGEYYESEVCGWMRQYGATPTAYLGNGCFAVSEYNGNNYGGEFRADKLVKYSSKLKGCGVVAKLSSSWDPTHIEENLNCWDFYVANDENVIALAVEDDQSLYSHEYIDFGKNYEFDDSGELVKNDLMNKFDEAVKAHTIEGAFEKLGWK